VTCDKCGSEVRWEVVASSGKGIMLDAEASNDGRYVILPNTGARLATDVDRRLLRPLHRCHWDACPAGSP
jgi:hypothetical protein